MGRGAAENASGPTLTPRRARIDVESCQLRELRSEDVEVLRAWLSDQGIKDYAGGESALSFTEDPTCDALALVDGSDRVVGFATLEPCLGGLSPMCLLATDPAHRGEGLGQKLFEELAAWGRDNTEFGVVYGEVSGSNVACHRAFEKAGWHVLDTDDDGYMTICSAPAPGPAWR